MRLGPGAALNEARYRLTLLIAGCSVITFCTAVFLPAAWSPRACYAAAERPAAGAGRPTLRLEMLPRDRPALRSGWSGLERFTFAEDGELSIVWGIGARSLVQLEAPGSGDAILVLRVQTQVRDQTVEAFWNDRRLGVLELPAHQWSELTFEVPAAAIFPDANDLELRYRGFSTSKDDKRHMAVLFDWIEISQERPRGISGDDNQAHEIPPGVGRIIVELDSRANAKSAKIADTLLVFDRRTFGYERPANTRLAAVADSDRSAYRLALAIDDSHRRIEFAPVDRDFRLLLKSQTSPCAILLGAAVTNSASPFIALTTRELTVTDETAPRRPVAGFPCTLRIYYTPPSPRPTPGSAGDPAHQELATIRWALGTTSGIVVDSPPASAVSLRYRLRRAKTFSSN